MINPQIHFVQTQMPQQASAGAAIAISPQIQNQLPQQIIQHVPLQNLGQRNVPQQSFSLATNNNVITPDNNFETAMATANVLSTSCPTAITQ